MESPASPVFRATGRPRWVFAAAAGTVIGVGAAAFAAHAWRAAPSPWPSLHVADEGAGSSPVTARRTRRVSPLDQNETAERNVPAAARTKRARAKGTAPSVLAMNAELRLLRLARLELTSGNFTSALAAIAEHGRRFRNGSLVEEREALRVKSLAGLGRRDEATRAAVEFHSRFPQSVLLSTFEHMTGPEQ